MGEVKDINELIEFKKLIDKMNSDEETEKLSEEELDVLLSDFMNHKLFKEFSKELTDSFSEK